MLKWVNSGRSPKQTDVAFSGRTEQPLLRAVFFVHQQFTETASMQALVTGVEATQAPLADSADDEEALGKTSCGTPQLNSRQLVSELRAYTDPRVSRSLWELAVTLVPFLLLAALMLFAIHAGNLIALALMVPTGLLLLRLFLIQHDCGHGSFLAGRRGNDWLGRALGVVTLTPYDCWRRSHALHHAGTGNLDARGFGDVDTLTIREFNARSRFGQMLYRLYRHPLVLLGVGPAYLFLLRHRLPIGLMRSGRTYWISALGTNAATALLLAGLSVHFGVGVAAMTLLPVLLVAASTGVWLFYIQHQFEDAHWDESARWSFHDAALRGSSHLELPTVLRWFTANIGVHHVHHLVSRIPFYRLPDVLRAYPKLVAVNRFTARQTLGTLRLTLWDEDKRRLVSFDDAARTSRAI
jgi:omega-6 fatty acid desaturase (delta-12 desaturase)